MNNIKLVEESNGYRIIANRDFKIKYLEEIIEIKEGTEGAFVEREECIDLSCWISKDSYIHPSSKLRNNSIVLNSRIFDSVEIIGSVISNLSLIRSSINDSKVLSINDSILCNVSDSTVENSTIVSESIMIEKSEIQYNTIKTAVLLIIDSKVLNTKATKYLILENAFISDDDLDSYKEKNKVKEPKDISNINRIEFIKEGDLYRIKAIYTFRNIKAGTLGGLVESENNINQLGTSWIQKDSVVFGDSYITDDAMINGKSIIKGDCEISGESIINNCIIEGNINIPIYTVISNVKIFGDGDIICKSGLNGDNSYLFVSGVFNLDGNYNYRVKNNKLIKEPKDWVTKYGTE